MIKELSRIVAETKEDLEQIRRRYKICDDTELADVLPQFYYIDDYCAYRMTKGEMMGELVDLINAASDLYNQIAPM